MKQTPASKRFLPPSSSSRSQHASTSVRKAQFSNPSQLTSSSPFTRTPFSNALSKDEIETSFEEETKPRSVDRTGSTVATKAQTIGHDHIEEVPDGTRATNKTPQILLNSEFISRKETHSHKYFNRDDSDENDEYDDDDDDDHSEYKMRVDFSSPLPKRQKLMHARTTSANAIQISSSSSASDAGGSDIDAFDGQAKMSGPNTTLERIEQEGLDQIKEGHMSNSKFRLRSEGSIVDQRIHEGQTSRGAFKSLVGHEFSMLSAPLPVTFSPSRRRGKHDYTYGGAAETVRSWILDVANEQVKASEAVADNLDVMPMSKDASGRFDVVEDHHGRTWMLVQQEHPKGTLMFAKNSGQEHLRSVVLKGTRTTWPIKLSDQASHDPNADRIYVAVLWEEVHKGKMK